MGGDGLVFSAAGRFYASRTGCTRLQGTLSAPSAHLLQLYSAFAISPSITNSAGLQEAVLLVKTCRVAPHWPDPVERLDSVLHYGQLNPTTCSGQGSISGSGTWPFGAPSCPLPLRSASPRQALRLHLRFRNEEPEEEAQETSGGLRRI